MIPQQAFPPGHFQFLERLSGLTRPGLSILSTICSDTAAVGILLAVTRGFAYRMQTARAPEKEGHVEARMVIHVTGKLSKKLHIPGLPQGHIPAGPHLRWYANIFVANRTHYILTTNAASLFSVVMYGRGITDRSAYLNGLLSVLGEHLNGHGLRLIFERCILAHAGGYAFCATEDRSVLGSMNDMVRFCKSSAADRSLCPWELTELINGTPFSAIGYRQPGDAFVRMPVGDGRESEIDPIGRRQTKV
jgi:hypothetical protein